MVKIKTLKNDETGERYAPRTHTKAVYDDNGNTLDSLMAVQDEKLSELGSKVLELDKFSRIENIVFNYGTQVSVGNVVGQTALLEEELKEGRASAVIECCEGDKFIVSGYGSQEHGYPLWAFVDKDNKILSYETNNNGYDVEVKAPIHSVKIIINSIADSLSRGNNKQSLSSKAIRQIENRTDELEFGLDTLSFLAKNEDITFEQGYRINIGTTIGKKLSLNKEEKEDRSCAIISCSEGDRFVISGYGSQEYGYALYAFVDSDNILLFYETTNTAKNKRVVAPANVSKIIINSTTSALSNGYNVKITSSNDVQRNTEQIKTINYLTGCSYIEFKNYTFIACPTGGVGKKCQMKEEYSDKFCCSMMSCSCGDRFIVSGYGSASYAMWAFLDEQGYVISCADNYSYTNEHITAPPKTAKVVLNSLMTSIGKGLNVFSIKGEFTLGDNFFIRNKEQIDRLPTLGKAAFIQSESYIKPLSFVHISDMHVTSSAHENIDNAVSLLNYASRYGKVKFMIDTGDIHYNSFSDDFKPFVDAVEKAKLPVFVVAGNHDAGYRNVVDKCPTSDDDVYQKMFAPFIDSWGLTTDGGGNPHPEGKCYYFKDFTEQKVRLIVLYEFENDWEVSEEDPTLLKYSSGSRAFRQEQIDWFIDSLSTVPDGYGVIIAKHQPEYVSGVSENPFNGERKGSADMSTCGVNINMIVNIVKAFIDRSSFTATYQQTSQVVTTLHVNADFSSKSDSAEFICYLSGHKHCDGISFVKNFENQLELNIGCNNYNNYSGSDIEQLYGTRAQDLINVYSIDRNKKTINILRIGADYSNTSQRRDFMSIKYVV